MLDVDHATDFLLALGLIDRSWVVDGPLTVRRLARRNRNLMVEGPGGAGYLVKQPDDPADGGPETLRREAEFYELCRSAPEAAALGDVLPRIAHRDPGSAVLVVERVRDALPLGEDAWDQADPAASAGVARALGRALGTVHRTFRLPDPASDSRLAWLPHDAPGVFRTARPGPGLLATLSPANYQMLRSVQSQGWPGDRLERLRRGWRVETVIHGDVRFDNVLVRPSRGEPGDARTGPVVTLVDWELVQLGDPAWDLAGVLQGFLSLWVFSMPVAPGLSTEEMAARARRPLSAFRGAIRSFWGGYREAAGVSGPEADEALHRAVAYSAARLIQTTYELSFEAERLSAHAVVLLQLAANLLSDPGLGQVRLFGIPHGSTPR